jgi:Tfp pilus assembly protein PilE
MIVVVIIGILAAISIPNYIALTGRAKEASVKKNMHLLQTAAEDFAAVSSGRYPDDATSTSEDGLTLMQHMPGAVYPNNPFTAAATVVQFDADPTLGNPGELGFNPATPDSYAIRAVDADGGIMNFELKTGM